MLKIYTKDKYNFTNKYSQINQITQWDKLW